MANRRFSERCSISVIVQLKRGFDESMIPSLAEHFDSSVGSRGEFLRSSVDSSFGHIRVYPTLGLAYGSVTEAGYRSLGQHLGVRSVHTVGALKQVKSASAWMPDTETVLPQDGISWGIKALEANKLWDHGFTGAGVLVGHIDTGIDGNHPVFEGAIQSLTVISSDGRAEASGSLNTDAGYHGTRTAAIIAGQNFGGIRTGVAPGAKLLSARATDTAGDAMARVFAAVEWALANHAKVMNLSFSLSGAPRLSALLMKKILYNGCLPVGAIGNEPVGGSVAPANCDECLSVGALGLNGKVMDISCSEVMTGGRFVPDIVAPGEDIIFALPGGGYVTESGTSMATPHIAGLAALLLEAFPLASPLQLDSAIQRSAQCTSELESSRGGNGLPNGPRAYAYLKSILES